MSQKCMFRCGRPSEGSIGLMRYCYACVADLCGWEANDKRLRNVVDIDLYDDGKPTGRAHWIPDAAISRQRAR